MRRAKFYIYRNLHTGTFSVKHRGKVVDHPVAFFGFDAEYKVSEKGRQRVIKEKRKNVHAFVAVDNYIKFDEGFRCTGNEWQRANYNPYQAGSFTDRDGNVLSSARFVYGNLSLTGQRGLFFDN